MPNDGRAKLPCLKADLLEYGGVEGNFSFQAGRELSLTLLSQSGKVVAIAKGEASRVSEDDRMLETCRFETVDDGVEFEERGLVDAEDESSAEPPFTVTGREIVERVRESVELPVAAEVRNERYNGNRLGAGKNRIHGLFSSCTKGQ